LILSAKTSRDYAQDVAAANHLSFLDARTRLSSDLVVSGAAPTALEAAYDGLDRDYRVVVYLLQHAANFQPSKESFEHWVLRCDYHLMGVWYHLTRSLSASLARRALLEMAAIINYMANSMGERVAVSARASV
jgi:hypothetical protein